MFSFSKFSDKNEGWILNPNRNDHANQQTVFLYRMYKKIYIQIQLQNVPLHILQ